MKKKHPEYQGLTSSPPLHWKQILAQLVKKQSEKSAFEAFGKDMSPSEILELLDWSTSDSCPLGRDMISATFAGIQQGVFCTALTNTSPEQLNILRQYSSMETVLHHIVQLSHELKRECGVFNDLITKEIKRIQTLNLSEIIPDEIESIHEELREIRKQGEEIIHTTAKTLGLAWHTSRADIIQELSHTKELCQQCLNKSVGFFKTNEKPSTGLWESLEQRLDLVFSDVDTKDNITFMKDTDLALEALVKFSVWHLRDYYEIGLIPQSTKEVPAEREENLFALAERKLSKLGLHTLKDLKDKNIYSKRALVLYLTKKMQETTSCHS